MDKELEEAIAELAERLMELGIAIAEAEEEQG